MIMRMYFLLSGWIELQTKTLSKLWQGFVEADRLLDCHSLTTLTTPTSKQHHSWVESQ